MWGDVDVVWTIIFIIIVIAFSYWAFVVFTRGPVAQTPPPRPPSISDVDALDVKIFDKFINDLII